MRRREFMAALGSIPLCAIGTRAQPPDRIRRIGWLTASAENDPLAKRYFGAVAQGLQKLGWVEGRNFQIEYRRPHGGVITKDIADEIVRAQPDILVGGSTASLKVLQQATRTIPILFMNVSDPVRAGLVASLGRPGGNITGFTTYEPTMTGKWLELLKAVAPHLSKVLILFNPNTAPHHLYTEPLKAGAPSFGLEAVPAPVQTSADIEVALARTDESGGWGMVALPDPFLYVHRDQISNLAARYRVPAVYPYRYHVTNGGLISHGVDQIDQYAQAATYVDRILRGEKPGDLPVQAPVKFETIINLKVARALGLEVPDTILAQADEVIE